MNANEQHKMNMIINIQMMNEHCNRFELFESLAIRTIAELEDLQDARIIEYNSFLRSTV